MGDGLLLVSLLASALMTGVVVFVQWVHYPGFALVPPEAFAGYHRRHSSATTAVVMPLMVLEAVTAGALWWQLPWTGLNGVQGLLVVAVWASTFGIQVPQHARLSRGYDAGTIRQLVRWNWVRVVLWSARVVVVAVMLGA